MEKRIGDLIQSFEHCRFEECLRQINQIQRKLQKDKKDNKKNKLSQNQQTVLTITKIGSLASTGILHQANTISQKQFINCEHINSDVVFLFLQIMQLCMSNRTEKFIQQLEEKYKDKQINIRRFEIQYKQFSYISKSYIKKYAKSKKLADMLCNIESQFLNALSQKKLIIYSHDPTYEKIQLDIKMMSLFLNKLITQHESIGDNANQLDDKGKKALANLRLRLALYAGNFNQAKQLYARYKQIIEPWRFLRSIRLGDQQFYVKGCLQIFRKNLNIDNYTPFYDYYDQFFKNILKKCENPSKTISQTKFILLSQEQMYSYQQSSEKQLINYYNSLYTQYSNLLKMDQKKDYFKIALKGLLLQLIKISELSDINLDFVRAYRNCFSKTFTYYEQVRSFGDKVEDQCPGGFKQQDKLIYKVNSQKIYKKSSPTNLQELYKMNKYYTQLYQCNRKQIQKDKPLEKGQRYISDQFIIILVDYTRTFTQNISLKQQELVGVYINIVKILENSAQKSPYNFDLSLRLLHFYSKLGYYDALSQLFETLDIKSIQFETVGFWILKPILQYRLWQQHDKLVIRILKSYQQNYRQSAEYALKALQRHSFNEVEQYLAYEDVGQRSYNRVLVLYILYNMNSKKGDSQFYLYKIKQILSNKLTLNCDCRTIKNQVTNMDYAQFYGLYNNPSLLKEEVHISLCEKKLIQKQKIEILKPTQWESNQFFNFQQFQIFQRKINFKLAPNTQKQYNTIIAVYHNCIIIRYQIVVLVNQILFCQEYKGTNEHILKLITDFEIYFHEKLSWREQIKLITLIRRNLVESVLLLQNILEQNKKNKKAKNKFKVANEQCDIIIKQLFRIMTEMKFKQRQKIDKQWMNDKCFQRDQILERMHTMSLKDLKKTYHLQ